MAETARAHIVLPKKLLDQIDALVGKGKRSEFIVEELNASLKRRMLLAAIHDLRDAPELDVPGWESTESAMEWVRQQRRTRSGRERWLDENWMSGVGADPRK